MVTMSITVGVNGRPTGCTVVGSAGNSLLDSTACALIVRRARYSPATRGGQPVEATVTQRVIWRLPPEPMIQFAQGRFTWMVSLAASGVTACEITLVGRTFAAFDEGNCDRPALTGLVDTGQFPAGHPPVRVTHVLSLLPQGETLTLPRRAGAPHWEDTADIEIGPEGNVTSCRTSVARGAPPAYVQPFFNPLCSELTRASRFPPVTDGSVRRARMGAAIYIEMLERVRRRR
jgi:TonB family protein